MHHGRSPRRNVRKSLTVKDFKARINSVWTKAQRLNNPNIMNMVTQRLTNNFKISIAENNELTFTVMPTVRGNDKLIHGAFEKELIKLEKKFNSMDEDRKAAKRPAKASAENNQAATAT